MLTKSTGLAVLPVSNAGDWITRAAIAMDGDNLAMNGGGGLGDPTNVPRKMTRHSRSIAATWSRLRMRAYIFIALSRL